MYDSWAICFFECIFEVLVNLLKEMLWLFLLSLTLMWSMRDGMRLSMGSSFFLLRTPKVSKVLNKDFSFWMKLLVVAILIELLRSNSCFLAVV